MSYDCFISYASPDVAVAEEACQRLTAAGFLVWFDRARLQDGCDWHREIEEACEASRVVIPILTPSWKQSEWTRYETYGAETIIPVLAEGVWEECVTPPLRRLQMPHVEMASRTAAQWDKLADQIRAALAQTAPEKSVRITHLRYRANPYFVGREEALNEIHEKLFGKPTAALTQGHVEAITALGGIGKTTLARQYAEKFWRCYREIFWVDCSAGIESGFATIYEAMPLNCEFARETTSDKAKAALSELSRIGGQGRLLILDGAEDEESVAAWIPKTGSCHTLITSRFTGWSPGVAMYPVWILKPVSAREFLLRRSRRWPLPARIEAADALARKLEYLPLALEQAGAYLSEQAPGFDLQDYLWLYEAKERELLDRLRPGATEYPASVYLTWRATADRLPAGARAILRLHAFLAPTTFPVRFYIMGSEIVRDEAGKEDAAVDELAVRGWVAALANYSMIRLGADDSFSVHGLVQTVERYAMGGDGAATKARILALVVNHGEDPSWKPESRREWAMLLPHAEVLAARIESTDHEGCRVILRAISMEYFERGDYAAGVPPARKALEIVEGQMGPERLSTLRAMNWLGRLLSLSGDMTSSAAVFRRALEVHTRVLGLRHEDPSEPEAGFDNTVSRVNALMRDRLKESTERALTQLVGSRGKNTELESLRQKWECQEQRLGVEHPDTLISASDLADSLIDKGDYAAAETVLRWLLEANERKLGPEHPDTLLSMNSLAVLLEKGGDLAAAETVLRRALQGLEETHGAEHPHTLQVAGNLASVLAGRGEFRAAEMLHKRTLEEQERRLGSEHPIVLISVSNLAMLYRNQEKPQMAEPLNRRVLEALKRIQGAEHSDALTSANNLGDCLYLQGKFAEAEAMHREILAVRERLLGPMHPDTLLSVNNLAVALDSGGRVAEAEAAYRRTVEGFTQVFGAKHPNTIQVVRSEGVFLRWLPVRAPIYSLRRLWRRWRGAT